MSTFYISSQDQQTGKWVRIGKLTAFNAFEAFNKAKAAFKKIPSKYLAAEQAWDIKEHKVVSH